jgi:hypothetical protein
MGLILPFGNMPQDQQGGVEASCYGHKCAHLIAKAIGAEMVSKKSNECIWSGQRVVVKTAHNQTTSVGVAAILCLQMSDSYAPAVCVRKTCG